MNFLTQPLLSNVAFFENQNNVKVAAKVACNIEPTPNPSREGNLGMQPFTKHQTPSTKHQAPCNLHPAPCTLILIILLFLSFPSCIMKKALVEPRTVILPLGDTVHLRDGSLVYALPQTVFDFKVDIERRIEKPGPYARFAGDLLGIKDPINQDREIWSITGIRINTAEEPDPSEFYVIETNTLFQTNVLALKKTGLIMDLNSDIYQRSGEQKKGRYTSGSQQGYMDLGADEYFVAQSDTAFKLVKLDTAFIKIPYLVEKKKQLTIDQLAEKAAKTLLELRDGKHLILTGEANVFPQDKAAIDEMNRMEKEYLELFAGKVWRETKTLDFTIIPKKDDKGKSLTLFRFSTQTGPSDASGTSGAPVIFKLTLLQNMRDLKIIARPLPAGVKAPKFDKLYYRVPAIVSVDIKMGEEKLFNGRQLIYQFGQLVQLPANYIIGK
jgi:hypothetical protein